MPELGRNEHAIGVAFQRLARQNLVFVIAVTLGRVEERHATFDGFMYKADASCLVRRLATVVQSHAAESHSRHGRLHRRCPIRNREGLPLLHYLPAWLRFSRNSLFCRCYSQMPEPCKMPLLPMPSVSEIHDD